MCCWEKNDQFQFLLEKSDNIAILALKGQFTKEQSTLAYRSSYIPEMVYSLAAVSVTEKQLNLLQRKDLP
jgi:hypothetical protein